MTPVLDPTKRAEARAWVLALANETLGRREHDAFDVWLAADAEHARAYKHALRLYHAAGDAMEPSSPDRTLAGDAASLPGDYDVHPASGIAPAFRFPRLVPAYFGSAIAACIVAILVFVALPNPAPAPSSEVFETDRAEMRQLALVDGSKVSLGAATALSVEMTSDVRMVHLERGQAFFEVERDEGRPFEVDTPFATIRVVGTAFDVKTTAENTIVSVTHGIVEVREKGSSGAGNGRVYRLTAGDELRTGMPGDGRGTVANRNTVPLSWRDGFFSYDDVPLGEVIADANRYSPVQIRLSDPELARLRVTGSYPTEKLDEMLSSLDRALPVELERTEDLILFKPDEPERE